MESNTVDQLAASLANLETAGQTIREILAAIEPLLAGRWAASLEARAPRMPREDRVQVARVAIWRELVRLAEDPARLADIRSLTAWLATIAQNRVAGAAQTTAETGVSGTAGLERVQADAGSIRRRLTQAGEPATDADIVRIYNGARRSKTAAITLADLRPLRTVELTDDLPRRSAIGLPPVARLDIQAAIQLLPLEQRRAVGLCLIEEKTTEEAAIEIFGDASQRSRVFRLLKAAKSTLAVLLADYAPMPG